MSEGRYSSGAPLGVLLAVAATTVLFLAGFALPVGGFLLMLFTPQPGLRLRQSAGPAAVWLLVALATAAIGGIAGASAAALYVVTFALLTLLLPALLEREWSVEVSVGIASAAVACAVLALCLGAASPAELLATLRASLEDVRHEAVLVYGRAGLPADVLQNLEDASRRLIDLVMRLTPALFLSSIAAVVLLNLDLLRRRQRAHGLVPVFGDLTRWKCPPELVWVLIGSGYAMFLPSGVAQLLAMNIFGVLLGVYFCQGLVIAQFYMRRWHSPMWVNGLVYVFILVEWLLATGVTLLGVFDLWADFRRLNPRPAEED
jgi:uncharacterized protein YybS (DUF2232 family)